MDGRMDSQMEGRMEFLPILQDFVPCWGRCPATLCNFTPSKKQGKGTADLMMPFGVLLEVTLFCEIIHEAMQVSFQSNAFL